MSLGIHISVVFWRKVSRPALPRDDSGHVTLFFKSVEFVARSMTRPEPRLFSTLELASQRFTEK